MASHELAQKLARRQEINEELAQHGEESVVYGENGTANGGKRMAC